MTSTKIQEIKLFDDHVRWSGIKVKMSDPSKNIICKISNGQNCYERFGIHLEFILLNSNTPGKLRDFIGAKYLSVDIKKKEDHDLDFLVIVEISIHTNYGKIVVQMYNEDNGFYKHDFFIQTEHGTSIDSL